MYCRQRLPIDRTFDGVVTPAALVPRIVQELEFDPSRVAIEFLAAHFRLQHVAIAILHGKHGADQLRCTTVHGNLQTVVEQGPIKQFS